MTMSLESRYTSVIPRQLLQEGEDPLVVTQGGYGVGFSTADAKVGKVDELFNKKHKLMVPSLKLT